MKYYKLYENGIDFFGCSGCGFTYTCIKLKIYSTGEIKWFFMLDLEKEYKERKCPQCKNIFITINNMKMIESSVRLLGLAKISCFMSSLGFKDLA